MSTLCYQVNYGKQTIAFDLKRRARKTLEISVYPDMKVEVIAPLEAAIDNIIQRVKKRARWILSQIRFFEQFHPKRAERCYISGETHLYLGRQYRLKVIPHIQRDVKLSRGQLLVQTHHPKRTDITRDIVEDWYFERAKQKLIERVDDCLNHFQDKELFIPKGIMVRQMSQRWGSMTPAGNLILNRQLIKAPVKSIDYVIIHELCHRQHADHSRDFYHMLSRMMPDWEKHKMRLERMAC